MSVATSTGSTVNEVPRSVGQTRASSPGLPGKELVAVEVADLPRGPAPRKVARARDEPFSDAQDDVEIQAPSAVLPEMHRESTSESPRGADRC